MNLADFQSSPPTNRPARHCVPLACVIAVTFVPSLPLHAAEAVEKFRAVPAPREVFDRWEMQYDTAALWSVGRDGTPLNYTFLPQIISVKTPQFTHFETGLGDFVVRARLSLLVEPIVVGPETYFIGFSFSPSLEWWNKPRSFAAFTSVGGGVGFMDSQGYEVAGGQGQDFNLNWFVTAGIKYRWNEHWSASLGVLFQHLSNGGQNRVNPGVNALGPTLGVSWHF